jgi:hypothetical protein
MDLHKRSVTIEVRAGDEAVLGGAGSPPRTEGYRVMRIYVGVMAAAGGVMEGCTGIGWSRRLAA